MSQPVMTRVANRYDILSHIGEGGMGAVFLAVDRLTGADVALKRVLLGVDQLQHNASLANPTNDPLLSLAHEFRTLASLRHPNIISVLDYGFDHQLDNASPFFTMTLLKDAQDIVEAAGDHPLEVQVGLLMQMLEALAYLHQRGIVHRDLKPANVLVVDGHVYVLDFGLAIEQGNQSGETAGTLAYMAPEVLRGNPATEKADLFAVGLIACQILGNAHPYLSDNINEMIKVLLYGAIDLEPLGLSGDVEDVISRLLAKDPADRYADVREVMRALAEATGVPLPEESQSIRESYLQSATFVGREIELEMLKKALDQTLKDEKGTSWLIGGESGVGKSRLMEEVRTYGLVAGMMVLRGQAVTDGGLPYQIWRDALRRLVLTVPISDEEASVLKSVIPDINRLIGRELPLEKPTESRPKNDRLLLIIDDLFRRAAQAHPILVLLEDLQWATESLTVMERVVKISENLPLLIIGNFRSDEAADLPQKYPNMKLIQLDRLNTYEIEQLSASMLGSAGQRPHVVNLLQQESEGNVFFLVEVVRALAEEAGRLSDIGTATLPTQVFAGGVKRIVSRRLDRVPDWARHLLDIAAVAGRQVDPAIMQALAPDVDYDAWVTACVNAAVFEMQEATIRFAHDKLREGVIDAIEAHDLIDLHRQIAESIEAIHADEIATYAAVLYGHWVEAEDIAKQVKYGLIAAQQLHEASQYHDEQVIVGRLLRINAHEHTDNPQLAAADLNHQMGRTLYGLSNYDEGRIYQGKAIEIYRELDNQYGIAESLALIGEIAFRQGDFDEALEPVLKSIEMYNALGKRIKYGTSHMNLGVIYAQTGRVNEARDVFRKCYEILKEVGDRLQIARALNNYAISHDMLGELVRARELYEESLQIRREIKDRQGIAYSLFNLASLTQADGNANDAREMMLEALDIIREVGEKNALASGLGGLGQLERKLGNPTIARQYQQEALDIRRAIGSKGGINGSLNDLALLARDLNNLDEAWALIRESMEVAQTINSSLPFLSTVQCAAQIYEAQRQIAEAVTLHSYVRLRNIAEERPTDKIDEDIEKLRSKILPKAFEAAQQHADTLTRDEVIAQIMNATPSTANDD